jgi:hypothetical protein
MSAHGTFWPDLDEGTGRNKIRRIYAKPTSAFQGPCLESR